MLGSLKPISFGEAGRRGRPSLVLASELTADSESRRIHPDFSLALENA